MAMAKANLTHLTLLTLAAHCLLSLPNANANAAAAAAASAEEFFVNGYVFCEVCRVNFINRLSEPMAGATVRLVCHGEGTNNITYTVEGESDKSGRYRLTVQGDHEDEECVVELAKSSRPDCDDVPGEVHGNKPSSKVTITKHNGFHGNTRLANPLAFIKKKAAPECTDLIKELHMNDDDHHHHLPRKG